MTAAEVAAALSPAMRHAVLRCSDAVDWTREDEGVSWARDWADVVAGRTHCTFRGTLHGLRARGVIVIEDRPMINGVRLTPLGLEVQRLLRESGTSHA